MDQKNQAFEYCIEGECIRFKVLGTLDKAAYLDLIYFMDRTFNENAEICRCIVDMRDATSNILELDRFDLAKISAEKFKSIKMATLVKVKPSPSNLYETATNNRGFETIVTENEGAAIRWLMEKPKGVYF
jgi:hypothetical protein